MLHSSSQLMQDHHKLHPVAVDARPPSIPPLQLSIKVDDGTGNNPLHFDESRRINSAPLTSFAVPMANHSAAPPRVRKGGSWCCKCICWTITLLLTVIIIIGVTCAILYLVFQPKIPKYSVDTLAISDLRLNSDMTLYAKFNVKISANNPNEKIGIYYEKGGHLSVWYTTTKLCEGAIPKFYQGHRNKTKLDIGLSGSTPYGSGLMSALQQQQQTSGSVPLDLKVDAPVVIEMGSFKLRKVRFLVRCNLVVDSLSANNVITITTSNCRVNLNL